MDDVVKDLQDSAQQLPRDDRRRLGELVMEWEEQHGTETKQTASAPRSIPEPVTMMSVTSRSGPQQPQPSPTLFKTRFLDPSKLPDIVRPVEPPIRCSKCGNLSPRSTLACPTCGQALQSNVITTRNLDEAAQARKSAVDPAYFSATSTLIILIRGLKSGLEAYPRDRLLVGRNGPLSQVKVNLDLTPYNGEALGVSRLHAEIRFIKNTLTLIDLESDNGTFVNDVRLYPHEVRVLRSGDDVRFGKLGVKFTFKH
jgi:predicted component of type VI protein secretion system